MTPYSKLKSLSEYIDYISSLLVSIAFFGGRFRDEITCRVLAFFVCVCCCYCFNRLHIKKAIVVYFSTDEMKIFGAFYSLQLSVLDNTLTQIV